MMANPIFAILVHKLPSDCLKDALDLLPNRHVKKITQDKDGLKIYYKNYETAKQCILRRTIRVQESQFTICSLVTNLTLHGIRKYASKLVIKDKMASYGCVIDLYPVQEVIKKENFERTSLTDDYRVILGVPEVHVNFELLPLHLPDLRDRPFVISFFCRLCRQNGHTQFQCLESVTDYRSVTKLQNYCPEDSCSENANVTLRSSNQQNDLQIYKNKTSIEMDAARIQEKQINSAFKPDDSVDCIQEEIANVRKNDCFTLESHNTDYDEKYLQHEHNATQLNGLNINIKDATKSHSLINEMQGTSAMHHQENFASQRSVCTVQSNMNCGMSNNLKSEPPELKNQPKNSNEDIWNRIIPPKFHPEKTKNLLLAVYKTKILDIPPKVEWKLQEILKWNHSQGDKHLKGKARRFIAWLQQYLVTVSYMKTQIGQEHVDQPQNTIDDKISDVEKTEKKRRVRSLCTEIEKIVLKTPGVLDPVLLRSFLNQVRGRRKPMEIAARFVTDFVGLSNQLNEVVNSYYFYGKRGSREDGDIDFIKRLQNRLIQENTAKEEPICPKEQSSFKKQCSSSRILSQKCISKKPKKLKYDSSGETQASTLQMDREKYPADFRRYSQSKNLPSHGWASASPKSFTEVGVAKCSEENFKSKFRTNSPYDGHFFTKSSTERELPLNFRRIDKKGVPSERQSKRILDGRKPSRGVDDSKGNFKANFTFRDSQRTSNLNYGTSYGTVEVCVSESDGSKGMSNKHLDYTPENSTTDDFLPHCKRNLLLDNKSTELLNISMQASSVEGHPEITKKNLREILTCSRIFSAAKELDISKGDSRQMLSCAQQSNEHL